MGNSFYEEYFVIIMNDFNKLVQENKKLRECLSWALEWIDAVPDDTILPTMPGFDRDYVDNVLMSIDTEENEDD